MRFSIFLLLLLSFKVVAEDPLCEVKIFPKSAEEAGVSENDYEMAEWENSLLIKETDVTYESYLEALKYFDEKLYKDIENGSATKRATGSEFGIGYFNQLQDIKAYVLKQRAQVEKYSGMKSGAIQEFCRFISEPAYMD